MITACHSCELNGKGRQLEALIPSGMTTDKAVLAAKETLAQYFTARCIACRRCSQDDIRIERTPKNERPELTAERSPAEPAGQCTQLPEAVEDTLRRLLSTITALDPLDAMLLFFVARGGTPGTFGRFINKIFDEARLYGPTIGRATAKAKWTAICRKFLPFSALRSWGIGHGGRESQASDEDAAESQEIIQGTLDL